MSYTFAILILCIIINGQMHPIYFYILQYRMGYKYLYFLLSLILINLEIHNICFLLILNYVNFFSLRSTSNYCPELETKFTRKKKNIVILSNTGIHLRQKKYTNVIKEENYVKRLFFFFFFFLIHSTVMHSGKKNERIQRMDKLTNDFYVQT